MEHVVFYTGADGAAFLRTSSLEDAVRAVEHLRNVEGVEDARVFSMTEVPLAFKAVYRVEVAGEAPAALPSMPPMPELEVAEAPVAEAEPMPEPMPEPVMAAGPSEPYAVEAHPSPAGNGQPVSRGRGFFSR